MVMIQRKRPARATLVGWQGHAVCGNELGGISAHWQSPLTRDSAELLDSAPSLESVMRSAARLESALAEVGACDHYVCMAQAKNSFEASRRELEIWGYLP